MVICTEDNIKRGMIIQDRCNNKYLVVNIVNRAMECLDQHFRSCIIGMHYINEYYIYNEIDVDGLIEDLRKR